MTPYNPIELSSCLPTPTSLTGEHLEAFVNSGVQFRKTILQTEYEAKMKRFAMKNKQTEQRVVELANRRRVEQLEKIAKNNERFEKVANRKYAMKVEEYYEKIALLAAFKNRDQHKIKKLKQLKETKEAEKQDELLKRYWNLIENQNQKSERNATLLDRCVVNPRPFSNDEPEEVIEEIEIPSEITIESSEHCMYTRRAQNAEVDGEWLYGDSAFRMKIMERIANIKTNFNTCDQGAEFWEKTAPLWNRMTQCLKTSLTDAELEEAERIRRARMRATSSDFAPMPSLMQQIMMDDVDYNLTDKEMIEVLKKCKIMAGTDGNGADIVRLTRQLVIKSAYEKAAACYIVHGLIERSVFEFVKKQVSKLMFVDMRKTIDRLQHVNDKDIIPDETVADNDLAAVTDIVCDLIHDDESYGHFDLPFDDEPLYAKIMTHSPADELYAYVRDYHPYVHYMIHEPRPQHRLIVNVHPMPLRDNLPELIDETIKPFLEQAHYVTALFLSTDQPNKYEAYKNTKPPPGKITMRNVYRISRKISKFAFDMFLTDQTKQSDIQATVVEYRTLVAARSPRIEYDRRIYISPPDVDLEYFLNRYKILHAQIRCPEIQVWKPSKFRHQERDMHRTLCI